MEYEKRIKDAIAYVKANIGFDDVDVNHALKYMDIYRCPLSSVDSYMDDEILELMDEYGSEKHDLPSGWWCDSISSDDVFFEIIKN